MKKCYFETYRFSEDLDYTLTDRFKNISKWIYDEIGIEIIEDTIRFEIYQNSDGKTTIEGRLNYIGPLQRRNNPYRIKLDLTAEEILVLPPVLQNVHHPYSDIPADKIKAFATTFQKYLQKKLGR